MVYIWAYNPLILTFDLLTSWDIQVFFLLKEPFLSGRKEHLLKFTKTPLKIGGNGPKSKFHLPTIDFQTVSFRQVSLEKRVVPKQKPMVHTHPKKVTNPLKRGLFSIGNPSEPTIDFQWDIHSFSGELMELGLYHGELHPQNHCNPPVCQVLTTWTRTSPLCLRIWETKTTLKGLNVFFFMHDEHVYMYV